MGDRSKVIEDSELLRKTLCDTAALDEEIEKCNKAIEGITGEVKSLVEEMASTAGSQERYKERYEELNKRYNKMSGKLNSIMKQKEQRLLKDKKIGIFIEDLKKQPQAIDKWDESLWNLMVEKAIVQADGKIGFILYNGTEITALFGK